VKFPIKFAITTVLLSVSATGAAFAQTPPTVFNPSATIENDSANDGNFATGIVLDVRAEVSPNPTTSAIYGFIKQGTFSTSLVTRPDSVHPDWVQASVPYSSTLTGPWTLHVSNTSNFATGTVTLLNTPSVGSVGVMPFVQQMTITADSTGLNPMISWVLPTSPYPNDPTGNTTMPPIDGVSISVQDISSPITRTYISPSSPKFGSTFLQANAEYGSGQLSPTTTGFTIPTTNNNQYNADYGAPVLQYGQTYSISVQLNNYNGGTPVPGCTLCTIDSRSNSYFDYTPIDTSQTPGLPVGALINLPTVTPIPTTSGLVSPVLYNFNVATVGPSSGVTFIDPVVATGFIYTIGATDPLFASADPITNVGSGIYKLSVWNSVTSTFDLVDGALAAGTTFDFLTNGYADGVSEFEITGIDPSADLDPTDISAFITGLTFVSDGSFTGTMEAITENTTPLPGTWVLMLSGIGVFGWFASNRRKNAYGASAAA
jgi:hypothetical protein